MRFCGVQCCDPLRDTTNSSRERPGRITAQDVLLVGDCFEVVWVHATPNPTKVVDLEPVKNRTDKHLIGVAVSELPLPCGLTLPELAVALLIDSRSP